MGKRIDVKKHGMGVVTFTTYYVDGKAYFTKAAAEKASIVRKNTVRTGGVGPAGQGRATHRMGRGYFLLQRRKCFLL